MDLYIKIITGPREKDMFKVQAGITLGRSKADINLKDSKASSTHGKIIEENGSLYYVDLNSTNGTLVNNVITEKVKLTPGLIINIGSTNLEVISEFELKKPAQTNLSEWRETLFNYIKGLEIDQLPLEAQPFKKCIKVQVRSGNQGGTEWVLGYGPRTLGPTSSDLCLLDSSLEDLCLKIFQNKSGEVVIESLSEKSFFVNGQKKNTEILKDRLSIQIGNTLLDVGFIDDTV